MTKTDITHIEYLCANADKRTLNMDCLTDYASNQLCLINNNCQGDPNDLEVNLKLFRLE
jgi:hypothetical protein